MVGPDEPIRDERIHPDDPRYDGFRITEVWAFCVVDDTNQEGIPAFQAGAGWMPLVSADRQRFESMRAMAQRMANESGKTITVKRFTAFEIVEEIEPGG